MRHIYGIKFYSLLIACAVVVMIHQLFSQEIQKISLPLPEDMMRADLYTINLSNEPVAVLVLCPGANGNGRFFLEQEPWIQFAKSHNIGIIGMSFASDNKFLNDQGRGYYYASKGSGKALIDGIRKIFDADLPILLFGFSAGAHFSSRFAEWQPDRVLAWCAYSAAWWDIPQKSGTNPPGIIACGSEDFRNEASFTYFSQGRAIGKPWIWISIPKIDHSPSYQLEAFVRNYFAIFINTLLHSNNVTSDGVWINMENSKSSNTPSSKGWLPSKKLLKEWHMIQNSGM